MSLPEDLLYSEEHIWAKHEGDRVLFGVTEYAQSELGDIVFVELPEIGDEIEEDEPFGSLESVKSVSELYAPVSGKIIEVNEELEDSPELANESPYDEGWIIAVEPSEESELDELLSAEEYKSLIED